VAAEERKWQKVSGKTRPSQRAKVLSNVDYSNLSYTDKHFIHDMFALAEKQQAEIERLKAGVNVDLENYASEYDSKIKAEAIKEFANELHEEIEKALENNYKVKQERLGKLIALGITEPDTLLQYIEGKIDCLRGLKFFIKEMVGEDK
jgi:hypothetical protein